MFKIQKQYVDLFLIKYFCYLSRTPKLHYVDYFPSFPWVGLVLKFENWNVQLFVVNKPNWIAFVSWLEWNSIDLTLSRRTCPKNVFILLTSKNFFLYLKVKFVVRTSSEYRKVKCIQIRILQSKQFLWNRRLFFKLEFV